MCERIAKKCRDCGRILSVTEYYKHKSNKDGLSGTCKRCTVLKNKSYYQRKKAEKQSYQRDYYKNNKERYKKNKLVYNKKNPEKYYARVRKAQIKRRYKTEAERITVTEVIAAYGDICYLCGDKVLNKDIHLDHVTPLSRGGKHNIENIRATHSWCNLSKGNKLIEECVVK